jgi:hypothetical protein
MRRGIEIPNFDFVVRGPCHATHGHSKVGNEHPCGKLARGRTQYFEGFVTLALSDG